MNIEVYSGEYKVIDTGTIVMDDINSKLKFDVNSGGKGFRFDCFVEFLIDHNKPERYSRINTIGNDSVMITCYNFEQSTNTGMSKPQELARIANKKVYISLHVTTLGNTGPRVVAYTFYETSIKEV